MSTSSNEDDYHEDDGKHPNSKKRRIQRACDVCRRKKVRCDGVQMPGNRCTNCISSGMVCTYVEAAKKRGPPKHYVENLQNRLKRMEALFQRLYPDQDFSGEIDAELERDIERAYTQRIQNTFPAPEPTAVRRLAVPAEFNNAASAPKKSKNEPKLLLKVEQPDEDSAHTLLSENLQQLSLNNTDYRFFGKSSGAMLVQATINMKEEYVGRRSQTDHSVTGRLSPPESWIPQPLGENGQTSIQATQYSFPPGDLITSLFDLYFTHTNLYLPLLHRPTFERNFESGMHLTNDAYGATVLLVCAVGAKFSEDPRVLLDGEKSPHSAGWRWFNQVQVVKRSLLQPPSLYDLQFYCLSVQFLQSSSAPQACWTMVGVGLRLAEDVGAHRKKPTVREPTPEDELWKRAFWVLISMDRVFSSSMGRPCAMQEDDFDIDPPIECDDEYWDHPDPKQRFKQPANKPSKITAFNLLLKLHESLGCTLKTIYSINKSKIILGFVGSQWEQTIVAELDLCLNKWVDSVPDFLRWDPTRASDEFFNQSVVLYCHYYHIQILVHRPFIPSPKRPSPLSFPSLAICTNAARSCSHIVDVQRRRSLVHPSLILMSAFTAGIVLLLNIWGGKQSGLSTDPNKEMADVHKCMRVLKSGEQRWHSAGRLWDILYELASVGNLALPQPSPPASNKRERDSVPPESPPNLPRQPPEPSAPRPTAGSRRVAGREKPAPVPPPIAPNAPQQYSTQDIPLDQLPDHFFSLPMYSNDLGRLPLHESHYSDQPSLSSPIQPEGPPGFYQTPGDMYWWTAPMLNEHGGPGFPQAAQLNVLPAQFTSQPVHGYPTHEMHQERVPTFFSQGGEPGYPRAPTMGGMVNMMGLEPPLYAGNLAETPQVLMDTNTMAMWSNAPTGFELEDWGAYLSSVGAVSQQMHVIQQDHHGYH